MPTGIYKRKPIIKEGDKFNELTAIKFSHKKGTNQVWLFRCDCGKEKIISVDKVKSGHTKSCGCFKLKHGMSRTKLHKSWQGMKQRCFNSNRKGYENYGGRGITVCNSWLKFENFYRDMGKRPKGLSLDRIDNDKGYCKENCKWSTRKQQNNNTRNIKRISTPKWTRNLREIK